MGNLAPTLMQDEAHGIVEDLSGEWTKTKRNLTVTTEVYCLAHSNDLDDLLFMRSTTTTSEGKKKTITKLYEEDPDVTVRHRQKQIKCMKFCSDYLSS